MSQFAGQKIDVEAGGGPDTARQSAQSQPPQEECDFGDSSGPLFALYSKIAQEDDNKKVERCQKDADGILVFTALWSATVVSSLTISFQDLKPNPQDTSSFYLENIYTLLANWNSSRESVPSTLAIPPPFSPPRYAIWVNSLWFLSLAVSLCGALVAMMVQQWARQYVMVTQRPRSRPEEQARVHAFFAKQSSGALRKWGHDVSPLILYLSLLCYVSGGLVYLFYISRTTFTLAISWVSVGATGFAVVTLASIFQSDNLFFTPCSPAAMRLLLCISYAVLQGCSRIKLLHRFNDEAKRRLHEAMDHFRDGMLQGKWNTANETTSRKSSKFDTHIFQWTFDALGEVDTLTTFFEAIPGFFQSEVIHVFKTGLPIQIQNKFTLGLKRLLDHTFSSKSVPEDVRCRRLVICLNAAHALPCYNHVSQILRDILSGNWPEVFQSVEIGRSLLHWGNSNGERLGPEARGLVSCVIARMQERDERWIALIRDEFGLPGHVLRDYVTHGGNSVLLAILIHRIRQAIRSSSWTPTVLSLLSTFDAHDTLPGLQHEFCALWNEVVQAARVLGAESIPSLILGETRAVYKALHQGTDVAPTVSPHDCYITPPGQFSHPLCSVVDHRSSPTCHVDQVPARDVCPFPVDGQPSGDAPPSVPAPHTTSHTAPHQGQDYLATSPHVPASNAILTNADIPAMSGVADLTHHSIPGGDPTFSVVAEARRVPSSIISGLPPPPTPIPTPSNGDGIPALPSSVDSTLTPTDAILLTPANPDSSSFLATSRLPISPQVTTVLDRRTTPGIGTAGTNDDAQDRNRLFPTHVLHHRRRSSLSESESATDSFPSEDHHNDMS